MTTRTSAVPPPSQAMYIFTCQAILDLAHPHIHMAGVSIETINTSHTRKVYHRSSNMTTSHINSYMFG